MRVSNVSSAGSVYSNKSALKKNPNQKQTSTVPSFKMDVRIDPTPSFDYKHMPDVHGLNLLEILNYAKTAYKDVGSDNILAILKATTNGKTNKNEVESNIQVYWTFKDPERARAEILEACEKNPKLLVDEYEQEDFDKFHKELKERDPKVMEMLRSFPVHYGNALEPVIYAEHIGKKMPTKEMLDTLMNNLAEVELTKIPYNDYRNPFMNWEPDNFNECPRWIRFLLFNE